MRVIADNVPHGGTVHRHPPGGSRVLSPAVSHDHAIGRRCAARRWSNDPEEPEASRPRASPRLEDTYPEGAPRSSATKMNCFWRLHAPSPTDES
jgi:hypothetical protein